ncbi:MAG: hypothetical protein ACK41F_13190 [Fimbriimonadaceae bacterium]
MTRNALWMAALGGVAAVGVGLAVAQGEPQGPPRGGPGQGFLGQPGIGQRLLQAAPPVMVGDDRFLYILRGNQLIKVDKAELSVVKQTQLPMMRPFLGEPGAPIPQGQQRRRQTQPGGAGPGRQL